MLPSLNIVDLLFILEAMVINKLEILQVFLVG